MKGREGAEVSSSVQVRACVRVYGSGELNQRRLRQHTDLHSMQGGIYNILSITGYILLTYELS